MYRIFIATCVVFTCACPGFGSETADEVEKVPTFETDIKPIFDRLCNECHGATPTKGGESFPIRYDICEDSEKETKKGKVKVFGAKSKSDRVKVRQLEQKTMPPPKYPEQPTPEDNAIIAKWIAEGTPCKASDVKNTNNTNSKTNNATTTNNKTAGVKFQQVADILRKGCAEGGGVCHQNNSGGLEFSKSITNEGLAAVLQTKNKDSKAFITSNDPSNSRIYIRMVDTKNPMPPTGLLAAADAKIVEDWIKAGANYK